MINIKIKLNDICFSNIFKTIFWSTFRPFLHTKTKQANDIVLNENDKIINDKKEIAELFNDHFVHITDDVPMI